MGMVCHMDKKKMSDLNGMRKEDDRSCDAINRKNPDLDLAKTKNNYTICRNNKTGEIHCIKQFKSGKTLKWDESIKRRVRTMERRQIKNGGKKFRKDAVVCASFVLGADADFMKSLTPEEEKKYFRMMFEFLENRYGTKNIASFTVHKDEGTVGAHCRVFPEINGKLCAKDKFNQRDLQTLQIDLYNVLHLEFPTLGAPEFGNSKRKHLDEMTFKYQQEKEKLVTLERQIDDLSLKKQSLEKDIVEVEKSLKMANMRLEQTEEAYNRKIVDLGMMSKSLENLMQLRDELIEVIKKKENGLFYAFKNQTDNYKEDIERGIGKTLKELERNKQKSREERER